MNKQVALHCLGTQDFKNVWEQQEALLKEIADIKSTNRREGRQLTTPNYLLLVEHPHVYTLGKSGDLGNLLIDEFELKERGASFYKINRGGDITYHGPGQLVGYPILDLENFYTDIHRYLRELEEVVIATLSHFGLKGERSSGETGVWLDARAANPRKICAMGVRASRWITMHGLALNVHPDLSYFQHIIPCGIHNKGVTSMEMELGKKVAMKEVMEVLIAEFAKVFRAELI